MSSTCMYQLTLTSDERRAIDWIGETYEHGDDLFQLLLSADQGTERVVNGKILDESTDDCSWSGGETITFSIPENVAWEIKNLLQNCEFECFSEELVEKFAKFLESIV